MHRREHAHKRDQQAASADQIDRPQAAHHLLAQSAAIFAEIRAQNQLRWTSKTATRIA
jgi:hypothetical protein